MRRDAWWIELVPVVLVLGAFSVYATWRAFENQYYEWGPYLSPFYSPLIKTQLVAPVSGAANPVGAAGLPRYLLLLSQGLLPRVLS